LRIDPRRLEEKGTAAYVSAVDSLIWTPAFVRFAPAAKSRSHCAGFARELVEVAARGFEKIIQWSS
jgi:hypothetical protein